MRKNYNERKIGCGNVNVFEKETNNWIRCAFDLENNCTEKCAAYRIDRIEKGKKVEYEHTDDPDTAREIAIDHLEEHQDYYVGLEHMENMLSDVEKREKNRGKKK